MGTAIKCINISKQYIKNQKYALKDLSFEIEENTVFGYLGLNGAGKTTTINILTGLIAPTSGQAFVTGIPVNISNKQMKYQIGYQPQNPVYYKWMTGKELLLYIGELFKLSSKDNKKRADELLELAELKDAGNKPIGQYSAGMIQRLGIAQAIVNSPKVLFLDEPCSSIDPLGRKDVLEFILKIKQQTTVFLSTHILNDVERVSDMVGIIKEGSLILLDKLNIIKENWAYPQLVIKFSLPKDKNYFTEWILNHKRISLIHADDYSLLLESDDLKGLRDDSLHFIVNKKLSLVRLEIKTATLEDIFIRLIKGKKNGI